VIQFDPKRTNPEKLAKTIADLGYKVEVVDDPDATTGAKQASPVKAQLPKNAPKFFRDAFEKARRIKQPLVIDFWAEWCAPCLQLKRVTFRDPKVARLLEKVQLILVDLDKYPSLGEAFDVKSVPDVLLIDSEGMILDRLHNFVPPEDFLVRLERIVRHPESKTP
jgi:thioredoxin